MARMIILLGLLAMYALLLMFNINKKTYYKEKTSQLCKKNPDVIIITKLWKHIKKIWNFRKQLNSPTFVCIRRIIDLLEYTRVVGYWWRYRLFTSLIFIFAIEESSKNSLMFLKFHITSKIYVDRRYLNIAYVRDIIMIWFDS